MWIAIILIVCLFWQSLYLALSSSFMPKVVSTQYVSAFISWNFGSFLSQTPGFRHNTTAHTLYSIDPSRAEPPPQEPKYADWKGEVRKRDREIKQLLTHTSGKRLYSLQRTATYTTLLHTAPPVSAPFYVLTASSVEIAGQKDDESALPLFEETYPSGTRERAEVETSIETEFAALVAQLCATERERRMHIICNLHTTVVQVTGTIQQYSFYSAILYIFK